MHSPINLYRRWKFKRHLEKFGSKNNGYFNFFVQNWSEYKDFVLALINHKNRIVRSWGRYKFRINQDRAAKGKLVKDILPTYYILQNEDGSLTNVFKTHAKYAKRLYYGFCPVWWILHFLDWLIQETIQPEFSFGFDTLTARPYEGTSGPTGDCVLNSVTSSGNTSGCTSGISTDNSALEGMACRVTYNSGAELFTVGRSIFTFDTSVLTAAAIVTQEIFALTPHGYSDADFFARVAPESCSPAVNYNFSASDYSSGNGYNNLGTGTLAISDWVSISASRFSPNIGTANKTGITKIMMRVQDDINNLTPTGLNGVYCYFADQTGITQDPTYEVTYTVPITFIPKISMIN